MSTIVSLHVAWLLTWPSFIRRLRLARCCLQGFLVMTFSTRYSARKISSQLHTKQQMDTSAKSARSLRESDTSAERCVQWFRLVSRKIERFLLWFIQWKSSFHFPKVSTSFYIQGSSTQKLIHSCSGSTMIFPTIELPPDSFGTWAFSIATGSYMTHRLKLCKKASYYCLTSQN